MSRHIILTTDLSEESERAFPMVVDLAILIDAKITLLYVLENRHETPYPAQLEGAHSDKTAEAEARIAELATKLSGVPVETAVVDNPDPVQTVCDFAESCNANLIAMSSHGRSGLKRLVMGSFAEMVLRHSTRPVLVFPPGRENKA